MYLKLCLICLYVYLYILIPLTALKPIVGHFKVLQRSSLIKQCAANVLSKEGSTGLRVSETLDDCEALVGPWDEEDLAPDYGYAKLIIKNKFFQPPAELIGDTEFNLSIPGVFNKMTRMDVFVTWHVDLWRVMFIFFGEARDNYSKQIEFFIFDDSRNIHVYGNAPDVYQEHVYENKLSGKEVVISFVNDEHGFKLLFDGKNVATVATGRFPLERVHQLTIQLSYQTIQSLKIHRVKLTE